MRRRLPIFIAFIALQALGASSFGQDRRRCEFLFRTSVTSLRASPITAARLFETYDRLQSNFLSQDQFAYRIFYLTNFGLHWDRTYSVHWFSKSELEARELRFRNGRVFLGENDKPLSTASNLARMRMGKRHLLSNGFWDFVMMADGRIYVTPVGFGIKHTSLSHRKEVAAAGRIQVANGVIRKIDNMSGHYFPPTESLAQMLFQLHLNNIAIDEIQIRDISEPK